MWPNVRLQALELKSNSSVLSSVRCVLSNGISSPVIEKSAELTEQGHEKVQMLAFGATSRIAFVQAHDNNLDTISRLFFMDEAKNDVALYNPFNLSKKGPVLKLRDEEELIGVYGVCGKADHFTSFGFIVKAWELEEELE